MLPRTDPQIGVALIPPALRRDKVRIGRLSSTGLERSIDDDCVVQYLIGLTLLFITFGGRVPCPGKVGCSGSLTVVCGHISRV